MKAERNVSVYLVLLVVCACQGESWIEESAEVEELKKVGSEYLRTVMSRLQNERSEGQAIELSEPLQHINYVTVGSDNVTDVTAAPPLRAEVVPASVASVPSIPPGLTAEELTAIYNAAVTKLANSPDFQSPNKPISDFSHPPPPAPTKTSVIKAAAHGPAGGLLPGYYYYYYPIKSFVKTQAEPTQTPSPLSTTPPPAPKPLHMHATVHMTDASNKSVEPLFMAISGFIGMALMFAFSVLFVPKFGKLRSGEVHVKDAPHDLIALGRVVFDSMEGKDCAERLACELGRILRGVKMDNKPLRVLEIVLPPTLGKQIAQVRKAAAKRENCSAIPCKFKKREGAPSKQAKEKTKPRPWKKAEAAHHLWMKHFENRTRFRQPENIWERNKERTEGRRVDRWRGE